MLEPVTHVRLRLNAAAAVLCALGPAALAGQDPPPRPPDTPPDSAAAASTAVSPGDAFLRAVLLPGWGHASIDSFGRGSFYFAAEATTAWMLLRTTTRLHAAEDARDLRAAEAEARLAAQGVTDPLEVEAALEEDEALADAENLVEARSQQLEDWIALGIFAVFLSGADAFVSAHLKDFPAPIELQVRSAGGVTEVGARLRVH